MTRLSDTLDVIRSRFEYDNSEWNGRDFIGEIGLVNATTRKTTLTTYNATAGGCAYRTITIRCGIFMGERCVRVSGSNMNDRQIEMVIHATYKKVIDFLAQWEDEDGDPVIDVETILEELPQYFNYS
ncbi:hypothetical protein V5F53_02715 [Xanthobacter sp. V4C-4]|uniref:hypothetical protein n=1 Tax=Xanthobacter cornucopiae TaxID=3119924 RepID=UPI00372A9896